MSVSVVNGFLCYSSCDVAKARAGKDPHPKPQPASEEQSQRTSSANSQGVSSVDQQRAVTFGGALATLNAVTPVDASSPAAGAGLPPQPTVNILA